jgi:hypothetical protein
MPIYDMFRVELSPNGAFKVPEFGTVKNTEQFEQVDEQVDVFAFLFNQLGIKFRGGR